MLTEVKANLAYRLGMYLLGVSNRATTWQPILSVGRGKCRVNPVMHTVLGTAYLCRMKMEKENYGALVKIRSGWKTVKSLTVKGNLLLVEGLWNIPKPTIEIIARSFSVPRGSDLTYQLGPNSRPSFAGAYMSDVLSEAVLGEGLISQVVTIERLGIRDRLGQGARRLRNFRVAMARFKIGGDGVEIPLDPGNGDEEPDLEKDEV